MRHLMICIAVLFAVAAFSAPTQAQIPMTSTSGGATTDEAAPSEPLSQEEVNAMVARMSDDEVRSMLLDHLDAVAAENAAPAANASLIDQVQTLWTAFISSPLQAAQRVPALFVRQGDAFATFWQSYGGAGGVLTLLGLTAAALLAGWAVEYGVRTWLNRSLKFPDAAEDSSLTAALRFLFGRFMREIFGLVIFFLVIRAVGRALLSPEQLAFAGPLVTYLIWMPRLAGALSRFIMAPNQPKMRLVNVNDHWAKYIHRNTIGLILLGGLTLFAIDFNAKNGVMPGETRLGFWLDTAVYIYIALIAWVAREGLSDMMRGTDPDRTEFDEWLARGYPYFAIGVAGVTWVAVQTLVGLGQLSQLQQGAHYITMFWLLMTPALDTAIRGIVRHVVPPMIGEGAVAEAAYKSTKRSYIRIGRVVVIGAIVMIIANAWDVDLFGQAADQPGIGDNLVGFAMTLVIGYVVFEAVSLWINRRLAKEQTSRAVTEDEIAGDGGGGSGSRLATVLPLVRVTAQAGIAVIFGLLAVGSLGIDITPLLAGAGILGLAIGFGAQKLVSDVVSGIFFLVDDAFRVGEYVEVDGTMGTVEKISIRSMQLRHHRGLVHTIPYGEIPKLTNFSRDWVIMKLKFTVPFDTDPNKVKKIFKKIGAEMAQDELFKDDFLEPFKSQGVFEFDDVGMVIRGKFMSKPGKQFTIRKEVYNRVKREFNEAGIDFARREVRVALPGIDNADDITDQERQMAAAAAAAAAQQQEPPAKA